MRKIKNFLLLLSILIAIAVATALLIAAYDGQSNPQFAPEENIPPEILWQSRRQARLLLAQRRYTEAGKMLRQILRHTPENPDAQRLMVRYYFENDNPEAAEAICRRLLQRYPNDAVQYNNLGEILIQQGHLHDGIKELLKAREMSPNSAQIQQNLSNAYAATYDYDLAQKYRYSAQLILAGGVAVDNPDLLKNAMPLPLKEKNNE